MKIAPIYQKFLENPFVSTDTRTILPNSLFFALKGENFDANQFAQEALTKGANYAIIDNIDYRKNSYQYILVDDVLTCLQDLARYHREKLGIPIIALTGSNGKTTTKELIYAALSKKFKTIATKGNLNNHIGVPLTLLSMTSDTELGIVEMGANHFGEIAILCEITQPNYGYITNFGKAHLEGFGNIEGVIKAKSELYDFLKKSDGITFVNSFDLIQMKKTKDQKRYILGENSREITNDSFVKVKFKDTTIQSHLIGSYNFYNITAAIGIAQYFKVPMTDIKLGIEKFTPNNKRSQLINKGTTKIILDAYNANPTSMQAALDNFKKDNATNKIAILGDMFELGESAEKEHQYIADLASNSDLNTLILIGENFFKVESKQAIKFKDFSLFIKMFNKSNYNNATLLIKGSRGMALERILELFISTPPDDLNESAR